MKQLISTVVFLSCSLSYAGGNGGGGGVRPLVVPMDMVYSMGNNGEFERVAVGNWISGKWEVRYVDLSNQEKLSPKWQAAIDSSKMSRNWEVIK